MHADERTLDLSVLTWAASQNQDSIPEDIKPAVEAAKTGEFSKMERAERLLTRNAQEQQFLLEATRIILNA